jgi:RHS repeat-associated protein
MVVLYGESTITDSERFWSLVGRYYDPATGQFLSLDPAVDVTRQSFAYAGDDPVNSVDPTGMWPSLSDLNPINDVKGLGNAAATAWNDTGGKAVSYVDQHQKGFEIGLGIAAGVLAAATGIGAVVEVVGVSGAVAAGATVAEASTGALVAGVTATAAGGAATYLDSQACSEGNQAACVGRDLGAVGTVTGLLATLGSGGLAAGLWDLGSLPDAIFQGLGAFSALFGVTASIFDLTTTVAGANAPCET